MSDAKYYGLYEAICVDIEDPQNKGRIGVSVPQISGSSQTLWARACLPITSNSNHLDHEPHLASEIAAVLANHSVTLTSGGTVISGYGAHTHTVTLDLSHTGNSGELTHPHVASTDDQDPSPDSLEHNPHRVLPRLNQRIWVMFIAGDPNFPVWMGVQN